MDKVTHKNHRKRMKATFLEHGLETFSDVEKLEFVLFFAIPQKDTNPLAHRLLAEFGSFDKVLEASVEELQKVEGIGEHAAILLHLILETSRQYGISRNDPIIEGTETAKKYCHNLMSHSFVEEFYVICLSTNNRVLTAKCINKGTSSAVPVDIRDITNTALKKNCERIILAHNHPSGQAYPSDEDIAFTAKILFSCIINNIEVIDHIIVAGKECFSFEESNILKELKSDAFRKIPGVQDKFSEQSSKYLVGK